MRATLWPFVAMTMVAVGLTVLILLDRPRPLMPLIFPLLIVVQGLMGVWFLSVSIDPQIDVYRVQARGSQAPLHGRNPYTITFPDTYGPGSRFYPPGLVKDGQVQSGYPCPPCSLLFAVPGYLCGDVRYSHLAWILSSAILLAYLRPRTSFARGERRNYLPAVALLWIPNTFGLLENGWLEPLLLLMVTAALFLGIRRRWRSCLFVAGLFLCVKQYTPLTLAAAAMLFPPGSRSTWLKRLAAIAAIGLVITLPFAVWGPQAFFHSLTATIIGNIRFDSISYLPMLAKHTGRKYLLLATAAAALPAMAIVCLKVTRTASGFVAGLLLILLSLFLFSTQSFVNYYWLGAALCCLGAGACAVETGGPSVFFSRAAVK